MTGWRGVLGGALALIALQTLVQPAAATRVGGLIGWSSNLVRKFMDPTVPAIPDNSKAHAPFDPIGSFASAVGNAVKGGASSVVSAPVDAVTGGSAASSLAHLVKPQPVQP